MLDSLLLDTRYIAQQQSMCGARYPWPTISNSDNSLEARLTQLFKEEAKKLQNVSVSMQPVTSTL